MAAGMEASGEAACECFDLAKRTDALEFDVRTAPHPDDLYQAAAKPPENCCTGGFDAVGKAELDGYSGSGYIVVHEAFSKQEVQEIISALADVVRDDTFRAAATETARLQASSQLNLANGGCNPVLQYENSAKALPAAERADLRNVRKLMGFHEHSKTLRAVAERPALQAAVRSMLMRAGASEAEVAELEIFQSLALLKPPGGREKPWHQDNAYFNVDSSAVKLVGVWIALSEVSAENGAMHVMPGPVKEMAPRPHFSRRDWQICDSEFAGRDCVAVPLSPGGALLFSTLLPHGTPTNTSDTQRLALQFHFAPRGARRTNDASRLRVFGGEGLGVSC
uniref:Fe2OG dioxygenase domain-containing protein n=1 Tax=Alexandrium monilatum TaxID=311494 RepID=A0A7S4PX19_9DINO|mmetsp:Transcript_91557/g.290406  ORF Transcript_91557/g.290406 Transcript_91557/m.290406 type:complete len:337 (-) Transcript_91557:56-1066(-)